MGPAIIPAIMIAMAVASAAMAYKQSQAAADADLKSANIQAKQAVKAADAQVVEISRQETDVNRVAEEQRKDRMAKAHQELGTLRVLSGERGASDNTGNAIAGEVGYFAGLDLSRIELNRQDNIASGEASKKAARQGALNSIEISNNQTQVRNQTVNMALIGAGVQIAGGAADAYAGYMKANPSPTES